MKFNGFFTYGSFAHLRCNHSIGHHRGFDHFSYSRTVKDKLNNAGIAGRNNMIKQIRELCSYLRNFNNVNFFGFIHFFDTHFPYLNNPNRVNVNNLLFEDSINSIVQKSFGMQLNQSEYDFLYEEYISKLSELDYHLDELYSLLDQMENTTVIFTSDHGYSFNKNSLEKNLNNEEIQTPFIIKSNQFPLKPGIYDNFVQSSIDILPTVTGLYSIDDNTRRSGAAIFDGDYQLNNKRYAVSELIYHNTYKIKIVGEENCQILIDGKVDRKSLDKKYDSFKVKTCEYGLKSKKDFIHFMNDTITEINFEKSFGYKFKELLESLD